MTAGLNVAIFLTSAGVDLVRKRAIDGLTVYPLEPLAAMVKDFLARGGRLRRARTSTSQDRLTCGAHGFDAISTSLATVFILRAVPVLAAGSLSFERPMPLP